MNSDDNLEKLLLCPHDDAAERAVLGAILLGTAFDMCAEVIKEADLYWAKHQKIYAAMHRLASRNESIDVITVADELTHTGDLEQVGGVAILHELTLEVVSGAGLQAHARVIRELAALRALQKVGVQVQLEVRDRKDSQEIARDAEQQLFAALWQRQVTAWQTQQGLIHEVLDQIDALQKRGTKMVGITTGLKDLDEVLQGWKKSDLVIIAGRTTMGKTAFSLGTSIAAARAGARVAIISLEMSRQQLGFRLFSHESGVDLHHLTSGRLTSQEYAAVANAASSLDKLPMWYMDAQPMTLDQLRGMVRKLKMQYGVELVMVDYLQLMHNPKNREGRQSEIAEISRGLKLIAKELDVCILALSQVSRKCEDREDKRPTLSDLRESGAIEQDADVVIMLYRDEMYYKNSEDEGIAEILVRKHRNGPTGEIRAAYLKECARFANLAKPQMNHDDLTRRTA